VSSGHILRQTQPLDRQRASEFAGSLADCAKTQTDTAVEKLLIEYYDNQEIKIQEWGLQLF
jgi:hypothetical protein